MPGKKILILFVLAAFFAAGAFYVTQMNAPSQTETTTSKEASTNTARSVSNDLTVSLLEAKTPSPSPDILNIYEEGSDDAPVTIYEFASYSCGHCAVFFKEVYPEVKKKLVDTGKARFVFRDFPLNAPALYASRLAHCVDQSRYAGMVDVLFSTQDSWVVAKDPLDALSQTGRLAGLSQEKFNECQTNQQLEIAILTAMQEARADYQLTSTPSFVFIGKDGRIEKFAGVHKVEDFEKVVESLSK